jgi:hypothetical protein
MGNKLEEVLTNSIETTRDIIIPIGVNVTLTGSYELKWTNIGATLMIARDASFDP